MIILTIVPIVCNISASVAASLKNVMTVKGESITFQCPFIGNLLSSRYNQVVYWVFSILHPQHSDTTIITHNVKHPYNMNMTVFPSCKSDKENCCNFTNQLDIHEVSLKVSYFNVSCWKFWQSGGVTESHSATVSKCISQVVIVIFYAYFLLQNLTASTRSIEIYI